MQELQTLDSLECSAEELLFHQVKLRNNDVPITPDHAESPPMSNKSKSNTYRSAYSDV